MLDWLSRDGKRLLAAGVTRSFSYGFLAVALGSYLKSLGLGGPEVGLVLTVALASAAAVSIAVGLRGDAWGRRRVLIVFAAGMVAAGGDPPVQRFLGGDPAGGRRRHGQPDGRRGRAVRIA